MIICQFCNQQHNGEYGSGRFCSSKCARGFSTKEKRQEINKKITSTWRQKFPRDEKIFTCRNCLNVFKSIHQKIFCSKSCQSIYANKHRNVTDLNRRKLSDLLKNQYAHGRNVSGGYTKWLSYKNIKVQGTYEFRACKILDSWKDSGKIKDWEYTKDRFSYKDENKTKRFYLLDFKIFENDGNFYYVEVKGYTRPIDEIKWRAVRDLGYKLEIWFSGTLRKYESCL